MFIGVDVGTQSARAGVFDPAGKLLGHDVQPISLHLGPGDRAEQSSSEIWQAVCRAVRQSLVNAGIAPERVQGLGFDATCSLVLIDADGGPLSVDDSDPERNVIVWMDHRAIAQADRINAGGHDVLRFVGGRISPEMQLPKLLWLSENRPANFDALGHAFDLSDFLTWKATNSLVRSTCTTTCKWTYLAHERRWDGAFFEKIGLGGLTRNAFGAIGNDIRHPGVSVGGLSAEAATQLGLPEGIPVSAGLIDAHAGGIGTLGARGSDGGPESRMGYVMGTSACTMVSSADPLFVSGVWGPYYSAMFPGLWLLEGGQSAAGAAIAALVEWHPAAEEGRAAAAARGLSLLDWLEAEAARIGGEAVSYMAREWHIVPDILGNRSPLADPQMSGAIVGIAPRETVERLVSFYVAIIASLGYGLRQIINAKRAAGVRIDSVVISGGLARSLVIRRILADASDTPIARASSPEPVLLGAAIAASVACGAYPDMRVAAAAMSEMADVELPHEGAGRALHDNRYRTFLELQHTIQKAAP